MKTKVMRVPLPMVRHFEQQIKEFHERLIPDAERVATEIAAKSKSGDTTVIAA